MKIKFLIVALSCIFFTVLKSTALPLDEGKNIFTARCMACHKIDKDFAGPALVNLDQRHTTDWIIKFVHSSQTVIKSGDISAIALFSKFNGTIMPDHPDLTNDNIKSIIEYIKDESTKVVSVADVPFEKPYQVQPGYTPIGYKNTGFIISFIILLNTLILVLLFAVHVKQLERKMHG
jgi:cytochrome c551/c552